MEIKSTLTKLVVFPNFAVMPQTYFAIVGTNDSPLFEYSHSKTNTIQSPTSENKHLQQFITLAALDIVDEVVFQTQQLYLKIIDKHYEQNVSAFVMHCGLRLIVLHENLRQDDLGKFMTHCAELVRKLMLNPFWEQNSKITNNLFRQRVESLAIKYF